MEFLKIWEIISRRKWIIVSVFIFFLLAAFIGRKVITPTYKATAKVLVQKSDTLSSLLSTLGIQTSQTAASSSSSDDTHATDIALASLKPLLSELIASLNLRTRSGKPIDPDDITSGWLSVKFFPRPYIEVSQYEDAEMLQIVAISANPEEAMQMANKLADLYIQNEVQRTRKEYTSAKHFVQVQMKSVQNDYYANLNNLQKFRTQDKTVDLTTESSALVNRISTLEQKISDLKVGITEKSIDYTKEHPEVQKLQNEVKTASDLIDTNKSEVDRIARKYATYAKIDLPLSVNKDMYKTLLGYMHQIGIAESLTLSNARLVESATIPAKINFPKKTITFIVAFFMGIFWGFAAAFFVEYIDNTIKTPDDIKNHFKGLTMLGLVPKAKALKGYKLISRMDPTMPLVEVHRTIRNSIRYASIDRPIKLLAVTSCIQGEGKSSFAANIAVMYASEGKKTIIVDMDLRRPSLHTVFGLSQARGLTNVLTDAMSLQESITASSVEGLYVLPSGPVPADPTKLIESKRIKDIIATLSETYDLVIIDTPPIMAVNDIMIVGKFVDAVVMVAEAGKISFSMLEHAREQFTRAGLNLLGVVLSKFSARTSKYHYYHYYGKQYRND